MIVVRSVARVSSGVGSEAWPLLQKLSLGVAFSGLYHMAAAVAGSPPRAPHGHHEVKGLPAPLVDVTPMVHHGHYVYYLR
jgi:hypothetical protein